MCSVVGTSHLCSATSHAGNFYLQMFFVLAKNLLGFLISPMVQFYDNQTPCFVMYIPLYFFGIFCLPLELWNWSFLPKAMPSWVSVHTALPSPVHIRTTTPWCLHSCMLAIVWYVSSILQNRATGDCYVQMLSEEAADRVARRLHKRNMGHRYIEIFAVNSILYINIFSALTTLYVKDTKHL